MTFREVKSEGGLIGSEIIDMEDKFFRQVLFVPPNDPSNPSIYKSIFMPTHINALHQRQPEIPFKLRVKEWSNKPTACSINMDWSVPSTKTIYKLVCKIR